MSVAEEIEKLAKLKADGLITDEEFDREKAKLMEAGDKPMAPPDTLSPSTRTAPSGLNVNQWSMFIHLGLLAGFIVPLAGLAVPIILWQIKKDESEIIDRHGKNVTNWIISAVIYFAICIPLLFIVIGALLMPAIGIMTVVFSILGGLKANDGEVWEYPLTIKLIK